MQTATASIKTWDARNEPPGTLTRVTAPLRRWPRLSEATTLRRFGHLADRFARVRQPFVGRDSCLWAGCTAKCVGSTLIEYCRLSMSQGMSASRSLLLMQT
jgi:hypothetical protein